MKKGNRLVGRLAGRPAGWTCSFEAGCPFEKEVLGSSWVRLGVVLNRLGSSWCCLGVVLRLSWARHGIVLVSSWVGLGVVLGCLGVVLGRLEVVLGLS